MCGKVCSGKSTYAAHLSTCINAVILSSDELMLTLFDEQLGDKHEVILSKCTSYLFSMAERIASAGCDVILDFGFWTRKARKSIIKRFAKKGFEVELHYLRISDVVWHERIEKRNSSANLQKSLCYYIDEGIRVKCGQIFQEPLEEECTIIIDYTTTVGNNEPNNQN